MNNPYTFRGPIHDSPMFFGRAHELSEIGAFLCHTQSVSVVGPCRIGKTSLVLHLMRAETLVSLGLGVEDLFVYINCQALSNIHQNEIFGVLCSEVGAALHNIGLELEPVLESAITDPSWSAFEAALRRLNRRGLRVVIILDEFEYLTTNPNLDVSLFNAFRSIAGRLRVVYLICSEQPLIELTYLNNSNKILSSPFFNIFAQIDLGLFSKAEAINLIRKPMEAAGIAVSSQLEDFIYQLVGGHPLAIHIACFHAMNNPSDLAQIELYTKQELKAYFQFCWDKLNPVERDILRHLDKAGIQETNNPLLRTNIRNLTRKCLLVQEGKSYKYQSMAWAEFIETEEKFDSV
jgi:hypothetical protein